MKLTEELRAEREAVLQERRAVLDEVAQLSTRLRAARQVVAELSPTRRAGEKLTPSPERRAARKEVRRLHGLRREARGRLAALRARRAELDTAIARKPWERAREHAVAEGVADYFPSPDEVDGNWFPGYARNPTYLRSRRDFVRQCREVGSLRPTDRVLDVGCGIGGVATYLIGELSNEGSYVGLDVDKRAIDWCRQHIANRHANFTFDVMDVYSSKYNPQGRHQPLDYRYPFPDGSFDFVIMRSLFTHMLPPDVDHYLGEVARLLAPGGRSAITYFLLDEATEAAVAAGTATRAYPYRFDNYRLDNEDIVEAAVAIDEAWVRDAYARHGLEISSVIEGIWRSGDTGSHQDTIYATRR